MTVQRIIGNQDTCHAGINKAAAASGCVHNGNTRPHKLLDEPRRRLDVLQLAELAVVPLGLRTQDSSGKCPKVQQGKLAYALPTCMTPQLISACSTSSSTWLTSAAMLDACKQPRLSPVAKAAHQQLRACMQGYLQRQVPVSSGLSGSNSWREALRLRSLRLTSNALPLLACHFQRESRRQLGCGFCLLQHLLPLLFLLHPSAGCMTCWAGTHAALQCATKSLHA